MLELKLINFLLMYFTGVNPFRAFIKDFIFAKYFFINSGIRVAYAKFTNKKLRLKYYGGGRVLSAQVANEILKQNIIAGKPFMFGRYGSTEINSVTEYLLYKKQITDHVNLSRLEIACLHNGLFPLNVDTISNFSELMLELSKESDLYGTFRMTMEDYYIKYYMKKNVKLTHLYMMDFWLYKEPFTYALKGKKVLVIHPLAELIQHQYKKNKKLFENPKVLPEFKLKTIKAVQTVARERDKRFNSWFDALDFMYNEALEIDFDVAILGCGAYGFPLAAKLKRAGKIAIHMGGVTQVLFGIKGSRWDLHPEASKLYNEHWIRPGEEDIPKNAKEVEDSCYW